MKRLNTGFHYSIVIVVFSLFISCKHSPNSLSGIEEPGQKAFSIVHCKQDTAVKYILYTPLIDSKEQLPVLLFFDPHAQGQIPLQKYATLADKYGFILMGSLNSKNGLDYKTTQLITTILLQEIRANSSIDKKRIYLSGFSGGAKLAMAFGMQMQGIAGVVACGGSINPTGFSRKSFSFTGMVGDKDFNYLEMQQNLAVLNQIKQPNTSVIFDGAHEWPPLEAYNKAFIAMETDAMKNNLKDKNKAWLKEVRSQTLAESDSLLNRNQKSEAMESLQRCIGWLNELIDVSDLEELLSQLQHDPELKKILQKKSQMMSNEVQLRTKYTQAMYDHDTKWWRGQVEEMQRIILKNDPVVSTAVQRVLNYLSMVSYIMADSDLKNHKMEDAFKKIKIYEMVDPDNAGVYLMYARYYYMSDNVEDMKSNFEKACELGFDKGEYDQDKAWQDLFLVNGL